MEDYSKILAVSGKPGLQKLVGQMKNGIVVESIEDGKRFPVYMSENTSALEDISIYTEDKELPLKEVFQKIHKSLSGKPCEVKLKDNKALSTFFEKVLPSYDKDRVYTSDIKKVVKWYNILLKSDLLIVEKTKAVDAKKKKAPGKKAASAKKATAASKK